MRYNGQKERKQVFINVKIAYLRSFIENLAYALILYGLWWVEQYIVNVLANEKYIGRVPEGRTIYWSSRQGRLVREK
jgi:hypothetical protein